MNITRLNFSQTLPYIKNIIKQSHFISIDLEMSGINSDPESNPSLVDSVQQRYSKTKNRIEKFIPLQIGVCCHRIDSVANKVHFYPFNFYIYPLSINESQSIKFSFHAATVNFLAKNNFDFNKLFYEHVPYISKQQLKTINERKQQKQLIKQLMRLDTMSSPTTKAFVNLNLPLVQQWINAGTQSEIKISIEHIKFKSYKALIDQVERKYQSMVFQFVFDSPNVFGRKWMTIKKKVGNQGALEFGGDNGEMRLMNEVMDCIVENKLPIVVHNGFLDMMHIFLRFSEKLPLTWQVFCQKLHSTFPYLYDTKFICNNFPVLFHTLERMTNLQNCYLKLKEDYDKKNEQERKQLYTIEIDENFKEYSLQNEASHEAGFDAMMTGYVFFRAMNKLKKSLLTLQSKDFHKNSSLMRNRIPLGNIKVPFNLQETQDYYKEHGNTVFQVRSLLKTIHTQEQIVSYFKQFEGPINFYWRDDAKTEFYLTFIDEKDAQKFLKKYLDEDQVGIVKFLNDKYLFRTLKDSSTNSKQTNQNQVQSQDK